MEFRHNKGELQQYQSLSLDAKIRLSKQRIRAFYEYFDGDVAVSFSGGKDSTVLLHLVRSIYPNVRAVFSDTGLEYPEIRKFAISHENVDVVRPKMKFTDVISTYGYPLIGKEVAESIYYARKENSREGKMRRNQLLGVGYENSQFNRQRWLPLAELPIPISHYCCNAQKKKPLKQYSRTKGCKQFVGILAEESRLREQTWMKNGCNVFDSSDPHSSPMAVWREQDVLQYIVKYEIPICSVYGDIVYTDKDGMEYDARYAMDGCQLPLKCTGCDRTGCIYCGFGFHLEKGETRFQRLARTHPKQYEYSLGGGQWADNPNFDPTCPEYDGDWKNWNPKKIWVPSKKGLGMKKVFDMVNEAMGKKIMRYD